MVPEIVQLQSCLAKLAGLLASLHRFDAALSQAAQLQLIKAETQHQHLQTCFDTIFACQDNTHQDAALITGWLIDGCKLPSMGPSATAVLQSFAVMLNGSMPLPRSVKEELTNVRQQLAVWRAPSFDPHQARLALALQDLYQDAINGRVDVDVIEARVDTAMLQVLEILYGKTSLSPEELPVELNALAVAKTRVPGEDNLAAVLSLAHNSLSRMHASQISPPDEEEESEEEAPRDIEEEDEDDPFFMPMPSAALKLADEKKFRSLSKPITELEQPGFAQPMLCMEEDADEAEPGVPGSGGFAEGLALDISHACTPGLTEADFEPVPEAVLAASPGRPSNSGAAVAAALQAASLHEREHPEHLAQDAAPTQEVHTHTPDKAQQQLQPQAVEVVDEPTMQQDTGDKAAPAVAAAAAATTTTTTTVRSIVTAPSPPTAAGDDKLSQFTTFLTGQNPGACMFHAQMRLSLDGCRKLSNFLTSSSRVRALSLSHNFLGDDGMAVICEGLSQNRSVTAIDLPDNNISDYAIILLATAVRSNPSLTQLQLAYNKIGDKGAVALAELIRGSTSLKKLGLANNNIGKMGCQALTAAISVNTSLTQLQLLPGNPVEDKDAKALAKAMKRNKPFNLRSLLGL